jgi:hypothetical protein
MRSPLLFCRTLQSLLRDRGIEHALTSGTACVEYGLQQNTKDSDWIIRPAPLASVTRRTELYDAGRNRARSLIAATDEELSMVAMPLSIILP